MWLVILMMRLIFHINYTVCALFKAYHVIPDFKPVFCTESKSHAHFTQSDQVNEKLAH